MNFVTMTKTHTIHALSISERRVDENGTPNTVVYRRNEIETERYHHKAVRWSVEDLLLYFTEYRPKAHDASKYEKGTKGTTCQHLL